MQKIYPCLWFDKQAEEAVNFYLSVFGDGKITSVSRFDPVNEHGEPGSVMTISFTLHGQEFIALNGGPEFKFTPAISLVVNCDTQAEIDRYWNGLLQGGSADQCGWLRDKFGISWQIVPTALGELMSGKDPAKVSRVTEAMLKMVKLDIAELQRAYDGK